VCVSKMICVVQNFSMDRSVNKCVCVCFNEHPLITDLCAVLCVCGVCVWCVVRVFV